MFKKLIIIILSLMFILTACGKQIDIEEQRIGSNWRTWQGYTEDYYLNDDLAVCFSELDDVCGYAVYDASNGSRIGSIVFNGYDWDDIIYDIFQTQDNKIGVIMSDGAILWYLYDPDGEGWSEENTGGYFSFIGMESN
ncbi:MAG: hypothetical protein FWF15_11230 [Oscillospiraceae bacterium]|nr:hypothetical protein [Oscillospiraceae bacterium]